MLSLQQEKNFGLRRIPFICREAAASRFFNRCGAFLFYMREAAAEEPLF